MTNLAIRKISSGQYCLYDGDFQQPVNVCETPQDAVAWIASRLGVMTLRPEIPDGFTLWEGGETIPLSPAARVEVIYRDGDTAGALGNLEVAGLYWDDIIAYRILEDAEEDVSEGEVAEEGETAAQGSEIAGTGQFNDEAQERLSDVLTKDSERNVLRPAHRADDVPVNRDADPVDDVATEDV